MEHIDLKNAYLFQSFFTFSEISFQTGSNNLLPYLDDFLFIGPAGSAYCLYLFTKFHLTCQGFGVLLASKKISLAYSMP